MEAHTPKSKHISPLRTSEVVFKVVPWWVCPICPVQTHRCPPGGQAREEQGSRPRVSSALPRIQIGQCVVGEEGHREGHTHTHTLTMNKKGSCQQNSFIGHDGKGHLVSMWGSQTSLNTRIHTHMTLPHTCAHTQSMSLNLLYERVRTTPEHVLDLSLLSGHELSK